MFYKPLIKKAASSLKSFNPSNWSITFKFSIAFISVAILPMSLVSYYNLKRSINILEKQEYNRLELIANIKSSRLDQLIYDHERTIEQIARDSRIVEFITKTFTDKEPEKLAPKIQKVLQTVFKSYDNLDSIYIIDKQGSCIASTELSLIGKNYAFREYFKQGITGNPYISSILVGATTGRDGLFFSHPISSKSGEILGVIVLKITASQIRELITYRDNSNIAAFLIEENGIIISHSHQKYLYHSLTPLKLGSKSKIKVKERYGRSKLQSLNIPKLLVMRNAKEPGYTDYYSTSTNNQQVLGYAPLKTQPWVVGISEPKDIFMLSIRYLIQQNIIFVSVTGISAIFVVLLLSRQITKSLKALTNVAKAMEENKYDFQSLELYKHLTKASQIPDDMGNLIRIFMKMAEEVKTREEKMKIQIQELCIQIDESKKKSQVHEITESKYFQEIEHQVQKLKKRANIRREVEIDYLQILQEKVKQQKVLKAHHKKDKENKYV